MHRTSSRTRKVDAGLAGWSLVRFGIDRGDDLARRHGNDDVPDVLRRDAFTGGELAGVRGSIDLTRLGAALTGCPLALSARALRPCEKQGNS
jgi:hypothetical protein